MHYLIARNGAAHDEPEYRVLRAGREQRRAGVEAQPAERCPVDQPGEAHLAATSASEGRLLFAPANAHLEPPSCRRVPAACWLTFSTASTACASGPGSGAHSAWAEVIDRWPSSAWTTSIATPASAISRAC